MIYESHLQELLVVYALLHFGFGNHFVEDLLVHLWDVLLSTQLLLLELLHLCLKGLLQLCLLGLQF